MPRRSVSLRQAKRMYDELRLKFFMDAETPLHIPPVASELFWGWLPDNSDAIAETQFEDGEPTQIRLNEKMCRWRSIARETLLHELTHIRLGCRYSCGGYSHAWTGSRINSSMAWHRETVRLANIGALRL